MKNPNFNKAFAFEERQAIEKLIKKGISYTEIARIINRSKNGVCTEIRRNGKEFYNAQTAHQSALDRAKNKIKKAVIKLNQKKPIFHMKKRIESLEMQVELLYNRLKEIIKK